MFFVLGKATIPGSDTKAERLMHLMRPGIIRGIFTFFAEVIGEPQARKLLEANLIFDLQPHYNNQHKKKPPGVRVQYCHAGDVPKTLLSQLARPHS